MRWYAVLAGLAVVALVSTLVATSHHPARTRGRQGTPIDLVTFDAPSPSASPSPSPTPAAPDGAATTRSGASAHAPTPQPVTEHHTVHSSGTYGVESGQVSHGSNTGGSQNDVVTPPPKHPAP